MTQPYGQQPGGNHPGSGGFQQPGGNYPDSGGMQQQPGSGGFPQAPQAPGYQQGYGGMPQAPQEYSGGPGRRPGVVTAASVLAYVQAGITVITTILVFAGATNMSGGQAALQVLIGVVQAVGIVLLIMGAVQLMAGKSRTLMLAACVLELVICLFYIILYAAIDSSGIDVIQGAKAVLIGFAVFFAIMPTISLVLSMGQQSTQYLQARRPVA
jgi:uncharacterized membrane protein